MTTHLGTSEISESTESSESSPQPRSRPGEDARRTGRRLAPFLAIAIVVALTAAISTSLFHQYTNRRDNVLLMTQQAADADARVERQLVSATFEALEALTTTDAMRSGDVTRISGLLSRTNLTAAGLTGGLAWVDASGTLQALSDDSTPEPLSFADRDWFAAAMRGEAFVGQAVRSRLRGAPAITFAVPSGTDPAAPTGVLAGGILLDRRGPALTTLGRPSPERIVLDRAGQVIVGGPDRSRDDGRLRRPAPGSWPAVPPPGSSGARAGVDDVLGRSDRLVAWSSVPSAGWVTMRSMPEAALLGDDRRALVRGLVITGLVSVGILMSIWWGYRIARNRSAVQAAHARRQDQLTHAMSLVGAAETQMGVAQAVIDAALPAIGARGGGISLCDENATHLEVLRRRGFDPPSDAPWDRYPITRDTPAGAAVLDRTPVYVHDGDLDRRFPAAADALRRAGDRAWALAPLRDGSSVVGLLTAAFADKGALDAETQLEFALLAERTAVALMRARRHEHEHLAAVAFQRSLLAAEVDTITGVTIDAEYYPGDPAFGIGGDWYDAVRLDDHRLLVMVGDVVGRGVDAAAAMGQLRAAARALGLNARPGELLDALSALAANSPTTMATSMCCVLIDTASFVIEYAHAGHLPIAAVSVDGSVSLLEPTQRPLLGIPSSETPTRRMALPGLTTLVLYTDGLVERRGESLEICLERLVDVLTAGHLTAAAIADHCGTNEAAQDDTVVVCVDVRDAVSDYSDLFASLDLPGPSERGRVEA